MATIGSGGTYATIAAWEADAPATLTAIWLGECLNETFNEAVVISGSTSSASFYKHLTTASGASFADNVNVQTNAFKYNASNGAAISVTAGYTDTITVSENYFRMSKLQAQRITGGGTSRVWLDTGVIGARATQCIFETDRAASVMRAEQDSVISSCLLIARNSSCPAVLTIGSAGGTVINCTLVVPSDLTAATLGIARSYASGWSIINCAVLGVSDFEGGSGSASTYTTCYSDDASPPSGVTTIAYDTATGSGFEGITNAASDFRLKSTSGLIGVGTTNTLGSPDAAGTARPSGTGYDVGAWEFVAAGGGGGGGGVARITMLPMIPGGWSRR